MRLKTDKIKRKISRKSTGNSAGEINFKKDIRKEFPNDKALQEIHIARKILMQKAKSKKMNYLDYVKSLSK
jgi:hypothetical protein